MKHITIGILAHADAGKTTLSEALLYRLGVIRAPGRVDHGDSFMDTDEIERDRGITVFLGQAEATIGDVRLTFIDTPGHADFSAETERALLALDYAILLISAPEGVQSHTRTLFRLLMSYHIPTFLIINKTDRLRRKKEELITDLRTYLTAECYDFSDTLPYEDMATANEHFLDAYLNEGVIPDNLIADAIAKRELFAILFISALKQEGINRLTEALMTYTKEPQARETFAARAYKIMRDEKGTRLTFLKILGGALAVKDEILPYGAYPDEKRKINEIRRYAGNKYESLKDARTGECVAVTGLTESYPGAGYGSIEDAPLPKLLPVLSYHVRIMGEEDAYTIYGYFKILADEDPLLAVTWQERTKEIRIAVMGKIQLEILKQKLLSRFHVEVDFDVGSIVYKETITASTIGHGHYEPLKHFADVRLQMEPLPAGSGIVVETRLAQDILPGNYQNQIISRLSRRPLYGVLTDNVLTDVRITLIDGKAHRKHTEGGDFRRATELAVRDGLLRTESILLEPFYAVTLVLPAEHIGRAMGDIERMKGVMDHPEGQQDMMRLTAKIPVRFAADYAATVAGYTGGLGTVWMEVDGYYPAVDGDRIIEEIGYDYRTDLSHPYRSIYVHGESPDMPLPGEEAASGEQSQAKGDAAASVGGRGAGKKKKVASLAEHEELEQIFRATFGERKRRLPKEESRVITKQENVARAREEYLAHHPTRRKNGDKEKKKKRYLLVDGYNVIFAWEELAALAKDNMDSARDALLDVLIDYRGFTGKEVIAVFDAYKVVNNPGSVSNRGGVYVIYTKEEQTADAYIERTTHEIVNEQNADVEVVSSDGLVQLITIGAGARRISSREFYGEIMRIRREGLENV